MARQSRKAGIWEIPSYHEFKRGSIENNGQFKPKQEKIYGTFFTLENPLSDESKTFYLKRFDNTLLFTKGYTYAPELSYNVIFCADKLLR